MSKEMELLLLVNELARRADMRIVPLFRAEVETKTDRDAGVYRVTATMRLQELPRA